MGADGGIYIINDKKLRDYLSTEMEAKLSSYLDSTNRHYSYEIDGNKYHVWGYGSNLAKDAFEFDIYDYEYAFTRFGITKEQLDWFGELLWSECDQWESWT